MASIEDARTLMSEGSIDLAIGTFEDLKAGFHRQTLFHKSYAVVGRRGHPAFKVGLTLERFLNARQAVYTPPAESHDDFEQVLAGIFRDNGIKRRVGLELRMVSASSRSSRRATS